MIDFTLTGKEVVGQYDLKPGKGPSAWVSDEEKPLSLRYKNVAKVDGMDLDLVVTNMTADYDPGLKKVVQGLYGEFGVVSVRSGQAHPILFEIVKAGSNTPIRLAEIPITLYDLDGAKGCAMRESVYTKGYIFGKVGSHLTNVTGGFRNAFAPNMYEKASVESPKSPKTLTESQKSVSASFVFANTASFIIEFDASAGFNAEYPDLAEPVAACNSDEHGRWMLFSMMKLPCEGSYLPSDQSTPDGHPVATVDSQADCQELAEKNSHPFYSFETNKKRCFTSAKCYEPVDTAADNEPWEIHVALWPKHTKTHVACRPTAGALSVRSELECQELALERGHRFYSFLDTANQCITSYECDKPGEDPEYPNPQEDPWHVREEPWWAWEPYNRICDDEGISEKQPSQSWCQRRAREREHAFYSWEPKSMMCKTTKTCTKAVQTPADSEWRIHIERWPINGDPGDGLCGGGFLEKISIGDGADCQSLCAVTEECKHYCYLDGGSEGDCRTYKRECGAEGKTGGTTPPDFYTCYDKPLPNSLPEPSVESSVETSVDDSVEPSVEAGSCNGNDSRCKGSDKTKCDRLKAQGSDCRWARTPVAPPEAPPQQEEEAGAATDPILNCEEAKNSAGCSKAEPPADGCMDKRGGGHSGDKRGSYNYEAFTSSQCKYYADKGACDKFGDMCEKSCGLCATEKPSHEDRQPNASPTIEPMVGIFGYASEAPTQAPTPSPASTTAVSPTEASTATPSQPTAVPSQPTAIPLQPTAIPLQPTAIPSQPTAIPLPSTANPLQPTASHDKFGFILRDTTKWEINVAVRRAVCPVTGLRVLTKSGTWAGAFTMGGGFWTVKNYELAFPLTVRVVSGAGAVGEEVEDVIPQLLNDKLLDGTKQFQRCVSQPTQSPTPSPTSTLPGTYDSTGCFSAVRPRETTDESPCVDAGHYDIADPALCVEAIIEENMRKGFENGRLNEDAMRENIVDWGFRPYGCLTKQIGSSQDFKLNQNVDGFLDFNYWRFPAKDPDTYLTYCCIPSEDCPCGAEDSSEEEQFTPAPAPPANEADEESPEEPGLCECTGSSWMCKTRNMYPPELAKSSCEDPMYSSYGCAWTCANDATASPTEAPTPSPTPSPTHEPVDCVISDWSEAGACSEPCGGGTSTRTRTITPAEYGGNCSEGGASIDLADPNVYTKDEACNTQPCPVDCVVGDWTDWGPCSTTCGSGLKEKTRLVTTPDQYGGTACGNTEEDHTCNLMACPTPSPTPVPTTASPTPLPTSMPTAIPTEAPTEAPTPLPTSMPTAFPTEAPTEAPTPLPTSMPTAFPTEAPTEALAPSPTSTPIASPTIAPTKAPTPPPTPMQYETFVKDDSTCGSTIGAGWSGKGFVFQGHRLLCEDFEDNSLLLFQVA
jgi:hypothetical protein